MKVYTNHHRRQFIYGMELTPAERTDFDWMTDDEIDAGDFFRYRGCTYSVFDFMRISKGAPVEFKSWDGYLSDSFFSGILIRYGDQDEIDPGYQVATFIS